jgi:hypothetical protein
MLVLQTKDGLDINHPAYTQRQPGWAGRDVLIKSHQSKTLNYNILLPGGEWEDVQHPSHFS